ncbi:MAG: sodium ion-translocating decarboxylase subunit beta [Candidatus Eisenbacteria bacterium]
MEATYGTEDLLARFIESLGVLSLSYQNVVVIAIGCLLIYLAIKKRYEPLLLIPIGFGAILTNVPVIGMMDEGGVFRHIYDLGINPGLFPILIFLGIGALTDFGPLIANPKTAFLGAAAQFGIFGTLLGALALAKIPWLGLSFTLPEASSIAIIGGADGPTAIYLTSKMADHLLGPVAIAAYSYMALVPVIQPPIMRLLTTPAERRIEMKQMREVTRRERVLFPFAVTILCVLLVPSAVPLIGMLMFGNLLRESGVVERLAKTAQNELINIVTIFLGLAVGATLQGQYFLTHKTIAILILGAVAFAIGTATGVLLGKLMCRLSGGKINPLIGAAGVSAVPMAARVVQTEGERANPHNSLLMHAMGPNVTGVIGSAVAAGVLLSMVPH